MMLYIGRQLFSLTYTPVTNLEAHIYPTCKCKGAERTQALGERVNSTQKGQPNTTHSCYETIVLTVMPLCHEIKMTQCLSVIDA